VVNGTSSLGDKSIIDKFGARYTVIQQKGDIQIDSLGSQIVIPYSFSLCSNNITTYSTLIIKFDSNNNYLYHLRLLEYLSINCNISAQATPSVNLVIDNSNDLIISKYLISDSLILFKGNDSFRLYSNSGTKTRKYNNLLLKINQQGGYAWHNVILSSKVNTKPHWGTAISTNILVNDSSYSIFIESWQFENSDTFKIYSSKQDTVPIFFNNKDIIINFNFQGYYLKHLNTFNFTTNINDTAFRIHKPFGIVNDKILIVEVLLSSNDSIIYNSNKIHLDSGNTLLLCKFDSAQNIIWVNKVGTQLTSSIFSLNYQKSLDYDVQNNEIILGFRYTELLFKFNINVTPQPIVSNYEFIFIGKFSSINGDLIRYTNSIGGGLILLNAITHIKMNNCIALIGQGVNVKVDNKSIDKTGNKFIVILDSLMHYSHGSYLAPLSPNNFNFGLGMLNLGFSDNRTINSDNNGKVYITGSFRDTLELSCNSFLLSPNKTSAYVLIINPPNPIVYINVCYNYLSPSGKYLFDSSGIYTDTIPNAQLCDSIIKIQLKVLNTRSTIDTSSCSGLFSPGRQFLMDSTGLYYDTLTNYSGCDSILKINFTRNSKVTLIDTSVCNYFVRQGIGDTLDVSGIYIDSLQTIIGCDSIINIGLTVNATYSVIDTIICNNYLSPSGKYSWSADGSYYDTIPNDSGCFEYIKINITKAKLESNLDTFFCKSYISPSGKQYTNPGIYSDTIRSVNFCDSIININLQKKYFTLNIDTGICDTFISPSGKFRIFDNSTITDTLQSTSGCDSIFIIRIAIDTFQVQVQKSSDLTCDSSTIVLDAIGGNEFIWQPNIFLNNNNKATVLSTPNQTITYLLIATNKNGCKSSDSINIIDKRLPIDIMIPNVFTPNSDGVNEEFGPFPKEGIREFNMKIFNRWGAVVFETDSHHSYWNGKSISNTDVSSGTYYYIIKGKDICNKEFEANGALQLIR
jgi:gliding motility-associated-like protein